MSEARFDNLQMHRVYTSTLCHSIRVQIDEIHAKAVKGDPRVHLLHGPAHLHRLVDLDNDRVVEAWEVGTLVIRAGSSRCPVAMIAETQPRYGDTPDSVAAEFNRAVERIVRDTISEIRDETRRDPDE